MFDDRQQVVQINRIPIKIDVIHVKNLLKMNLMNDIDAFL